MDPTALNKIAYLMDRLREGNLLTVKSVEQISLDKLQGHCKFVYMNVSYLVLRKKRSSFTRNFRPDSCQKVGTYFSEQDIPYCLKLIK
jgi:hypothetical protein